MFFKLLKFIKLIKLLKFLRNIIKYINGDLRKLKSIHDIYLNHQNILKNDLILNIFQVKKYNEDTKGITYNLLDKYYSINQHNLLMNETDRTSVGLLYHEHIIDVINDHDKKISIPFYDKLLNNMCFSDYIDRITFQKQIWIFNEMSSLIKTFYNNYLYHIDNKHMYMIPPKQDIRFTKVLTKYSTEYNNMLFIQELCQKLNMDRKDTFTFFMYLREKFNEGEISEQFDDNYDISKLDINRVYRYLDRYALS